MNKVLVGVPTYPGHLFCRAYIVDFLRSLQGPNVDVLIVWNGNAKPSGFEDFEVVNYPEDVDLSPAEGLEATLGAKQSILCDKQNYLRRRMLDGGYSHLLHLESDLVPPRGVLDRFLEYDEDIVSGIYFIKTQEEAFIKVSDNPYVQAMANKKGLDGYACAYYVRESMVPAVWGYQKTSIGGFEKPKLGHRIWMVEDWIDAHLSGRSLHPVMGTGTGCMLIKREVLEKVSFMSTVAYNSMRGESVDQLTDYIFCDLAQRNGFQIFVDVESICQHYVIDTRDDITLKNIKE